jgi:hypothetical protein
MPGEFHTEIISRTVMVTCPDNSRGGADLPPGYDDAWKQTAMHRHPEIEQIHGPTIGGGYVFVWSLTPMTDGEIIFQSEKIIKDLY